MKLETLIEKVKEESERITVVFTRHAEEKRPEFKNIDSMNFFRTTAKGKLHGMINIAIMMCANEYVNDDNRYWEQVGILRDCEEITENKIDDIYEQWYLKHINMI